MNEELKPCAFCNHDAESDDEGISCSNGECPCYGASFTFSAWNTRPASLPAEGRAIRGLAAIYGPHLRDDEMRDSFSEDLTGIAERLASLTRQLAEERGRHEWQTMESAPKDGTNFLAWIVTDANMEDRAEEKITIACYDSCMSEFTQVDSNGSGYFEDETFYYWMPLPARAQSIGEKEGR